MKGLAAITLTFIALGFTGCSRGQALSSPTPTPAAVSTSAPVIPSPRPISIPTAAPAVTGGGWLVYLRAGDLYVGALDGGSEQQLTSGASSPDFAGYARDGAGVTWIYYTSLSQSQSDGSATIQVDRQALGRSTSEELFTFNANAQEVASSEPAATVSPDGRYIAYTDERGLRIYDVAAHSERGLLSNQPHSPTNAPGNIYLSPLWAPAGGWLVVTRTGYPPLDPPTLDFIRPLEPITEYTADAGGAFRAWSADGTRLCASRAGFFTRGYTFDDVGLLTPGQPTFQLLFLRVFMEKPGFVPQVSDPTACSWSRDGRVAISHGIERASSSAITVVRTADLSRTPLSMGHYAGGFSVVGWLPDGDGVVRSVENSYLGNQNVVLMLDGSFRSVPFRPERIFGVIPPP